LVASRRRCAAARWQAVIVAQVRRTLVQRALVERGMRVLAACSGGPDSAAMLVALARLQGELDFSLEAASLDHGLRASAGADVEIARAQAEEVGVPFHALRIQVAPAASVQAAARDARYRALTALAERLGAERIAVGHTQDDQAETVIMRMLRGSGVPGLAAIEPLRRDGVMRPLIDCRRADVGAFAMRHCKLLARDPSNDDPSYGRVRVRRELLPQMEREDEAIVAHLADLADDARALLAALAPEVEALLAAALQGDGSIQLSTLQQAPRAIRALALRWWLTRATGSEPGRAHLTQLERADAREVEVWLPEGWVVRGAAGRLTLART
jgi:tRNA(Ile)-lysidine synthase